jgi:hypothetical protein
VDRVQPYRAPGGEKGREKGRLQLRKRETARCRADETNAKGSLRAGVLMNVGGPSLIDYIGIISCNVPVTARIQPCVHGGERRE